MQSLLQPLYDQFAILVQPLYDLLAQLRFYAAVIIVALTALCFAQTLESRATSISRAVYLVVLWLLLPTSLTLLDSFYGLLGFSTRENMTSWMWLLTPSLLVVLCASYAGALFFAWRKRIYLDMLLFTVAFCLMCQRLYIQYE